MPAAAPVADPGLNEFEVGGRWFACVPDVDPDLLIWVMSRAQDAPTNPHDPRLADWLQVVVGFLVAATDPADHDALVATLTTAAVEDPDGTAAEIAEVFSGLLALYTDHEIDRVRARVVTIEQASSVRFPAREVPVVRRRSTVADVERITRRHGRKASGEVITPDV
jgi:hypothetical protein